MSEINTLQLIDDVIKMVKKQVLSELLEEFSDMQDSEVRERIINVIGE